MKRLTLFFILLLNTIHIAFAQLKSHVDECFELSSIVFRLAEAPEYMNNFIPSYTSQIDIYFGAYKDHKLISFLKEMREKHGISYDAVPKATGFLEIKNGKIMIKSGLSISQISEIEKRWTEENFSTFIQLLNDFYRKTKFRNFYMQHTDLYKVAEERMDELLEGFNMAWFKTLFGEEIRSPVIIISLCNGSSNYSFQIPFENKIHAMVIGCGSDKNGLPAFNRNQIIIVAHEFLHNYTNLRIENSWSQIDSVAQVIYSYVEKEMRSRAYGSAQTTIYEWLTNLLTIIYLQDNPLSTFSTEHLIADNQNNGFIWMDRSVIFMEHFRNNRDLFKGLDDYMPQMIGFLKFTANHFDQVINEFENRHPYIVDIFPAPESIIKLDIDTIEICFSEPMIEAHGIGAVDEYIRIPLLDSYWKDGQTYVMLLDKDKLEKGQTYGIKLKYKFFQSEKTYSIKEDYLYTFKILD